MEAPVRGILLGTPPEAAANRDAMASPACLGGLRPFREAVAYG